MAAAATLAMLKDMMSDPPNPNEPLPLSNRKGTIYGSTIPFLVLSWIAVTMRMWVRCSIMRDPGWDDYLVIVSACLNTTAVGFILYLADHGLGHHYLYIGTANIVIYQKFFYFSNAIYITETTCIKLSLLLQYLRIFQAGTMRWICITLLALISVWGAAYGFMAWFPCFPVVAYWERLDHPNATCYGFGFDYFRIEDFIGLFESHTALNMVFDIAIFATPMILFTKPQLRRNSVVSMAGIFMIGAVVVFTSIWRLYSIVEYRAATLPYIDFTWWSPITLILSCLEINLAIVCASMPVFWPQIEKSLTAIFVTHEVHITEHHRLDDEYELEDGKGNDSMKDGSMKRLAMTRNNSEGSDIDEAGSRGEKEEGRLRDHYKDPYTVAQINPFGSDAAGGIGVVETNVDANPDRPKWVL